MESTFNCTTGANDSPARQNPGNTSEIFVSFSRRDFRFVVAPHGSTGYTNGTLSIDVSKKRKKKSFGVTKLKRVEDQRSEKTRNSDNRARKSSGNISSLFSSYKTFSSSSFLVPFFVLVFFFYQRERVSRDLYVSTVSTSRRVCMNESTR